MRRHIVSEKELLEIIPGLTSRQLKRLRLTRKIPYFEISYRVRTYDPESVLKALERLEHVEIGHQKAYQAKRAAGMNK
jgi:hypothetical protein